MDEKPGENKQIDQSQQTRKMMLRMVFMSFKAGCLTVIVAGGALLIGFLIDVRQDTVSRWMLIFLLGSMPFTLGGIYLLVRQQLKKIKKERSEIDQGS